MGRYLLPSAWPSRIPWRRAARLLCGAWLVLVPANLRTIPAEAETLAPPSGVASMSAAGPHIAPAAGERAGLSVDASGPKGDGPGDGTRSWLAGPRTEAYATPYDFGKAGTCTGDGSQVDDTAALTAAWNKLQRQLSLGQSGILDLRGGTCTLSAPIAPTGTPFAIHIIDGTVIPYYDKRAGSRYSGNFFDFTGTETTTNVDFFNVTLNGYNTANDLIRFGPKPQGSRIYKNNLMGFRGHAIYSPACVAGSGLWVSENTIEGNTAKGNSGTGIEVCGNDGELIHNDVSNVNIGIKILGGGWTLALNHIFPSSSALPIPAIWLVSVNQINISGNYIDDSYIYDQVYPGYIQIVDNRFLQNHAKPPLDVTLPSGTKAAFAPIVLAPGRPGQAQNAYALAGLIVADNSFWNAYGMYNPVFVDKAFGKIVKCWQTFMKDNTFYGYNAKFTHPTLHGDVVNATEAAADFSALVPWCSVNNLVGVVMPNLSGFKVAGNKAKLTMSVQTTSSYSITGTVNDDGY